MLIRIEDDPGKVLALGAELIRQGKLVAFPTETVYGLGANAWDEAAVARIFVAKGRPADNPLIVHIASLPMLSEVVCSISETAKRLMEAFWPGPLSLVLPRGPRVPDIVTAGLATVAVRWPNHPVAEGLIRRAGVPIAAPSANRSGRPSPTLGKHAHLDLGDGVDLVIDAGMAIVGLESTVVDLTGPQPILLRPGAVTLEELQAVVGPVQNASMADQETVRSPGMKYTHYAPNAPLYLFLGQEPTALVQAMQKRAETLRGEGQRVGVLTHDEYLASFPNSELVSLGSLHQPIQAAQRLYSALRRFDDLGVDIILAQGSGSETGLGLALNNRLIKASGHRLIWV